MTDSILNLRGQLPPSSPNSSSSPLDRDREAAEANPFGSSEAFASVLYYCSLILVLPILSFFACKMIVLEFVLSFESDAISSNVISAFVAVVVLHLALGLFIYKAYFEGTQPKKRIGKQE